MSKIFNIILAVSLLYSNMEEVNKPIVMNHRLGVPIVEEVKKYPVILTGYDNDYECTQSGRGITASGTVANRGTMAVPRQIPFGTKITLKNAPKSVHSYRIAEDRGGAIKVKNNVYKFDIWFETHKEAIKFGVHRGYMYWQNKELVIVMEG